MRIEVINVCRSDFDSNDPFLRGSIKALEKCGIESEILPFYSPPRLRARQFIEAANRDDVDYTWVARGGIETVYLLPYLDFSEITFRNTFIGSSDFTHLAVPIVNKGSKVLYGSGVRELSKNLNGEEIDLLFKQLKNGINNSQLPIHRVNNKDVESDKLIGGTLQILLNLFGTAHAPDLRGKNVFVEHHYIPGEGYLEAKYWLNALKIKLCYQDLNSLLVGELVYTGNDGLATQSEQIDLVHEVFDNSDVPVGVVLSSHRKNFIQLG